MTYELEQFLPLVYIGIALLAAAVTFESISFVVKRAIRRHLICARRNCRYGHAWGKQFGPFKPTDNSYWYLGWKCAHCPKTKTERVEDADAKAHEYFHKHGVEVSFDGWSIIQSAITKQHEIKQYTKAKGVVDSITSLLIYSPHEWEADDYHLKHPPTGISLWIANKDYGLKVEKPSAMELPKDLRDGLYQTISAWRCATLSPKG